MALIFFDGYEGLAANGDAPLLRYDGGVLGFTGGIVAAGGGASPPSPNGRYLEAGVANYGPVIRKNFNDASTLIIGQRIRFVWDNWALSGPTSEWTFWQTMDFNSGDDTVQLNFSITPDRAIRVRRGGLSGAILGTSSNGVVPTIKGWHYLEAKMTFASSGAVEVKVNGDVVLTLTSVDTTQTANNVANGFIVYVGFRDTYAGYDDLYLCDDTGGTFNDYLGDIRVIELLPNAAGDSTQWTPNAGANWDRNDDVTQDGDATYVYSSTDGHTDLYNLTAPDSGATAILAAKFMVTARKTDPGAREIEVLGKSGSTQFGSAAQTMTEVYVEYTHTEEQNPDTSANWTISDLTSLQAGVKIPT